MLGLPVGVMLQSMSATEFQTWRALAELEHDVAQRVRHDKVDPAEAERIVFAPPDDRRRLADNGD